jgi:Chemotaxis protein; stimulates methylation of MCP proteins
MESLPVHFLYPAELYVSKAPYQINTILGSCVAVCLFDPVLNIGGMNHFMLPYWNGQGLASPKYGNIANEKLLDKMLSLGCNKNNLKAKMFGGGEVIETQIVQFHIGARNIEVAKLFLEEKKIPIISSSVGGKLGRKIEFFTLSGEVRQKYVQKTL